MTGGLNEMFVFRFDRRFKQNVCFSQLKIYIQMYLPGKIVYCAVLSDITGTIWADFDKD